MVTTGRATTAIFYPETDGLPLPDGNYQLPLFTNAVVGLRVHFKGVEDAFVSGNTFLYYIEGDSDYSVSPDCYVVFGLSDTAKESLSIKGNNTYLLWEVGKPPDFVLEIGSRSTARRDRFEKRDLYADIGVGEYWRFDGTGGDFYGEPLVGERLVNGEYQRMEMRHEDDGSVWGHSDALNLDLWWTDGQLRYWNPAQGEWLRTPEESEEGRLEEAARADAAEARADAAEARADAAEARAGAKRDARLAEAVRADAERDARLAAEAQLAQLRAELRRLRGASPS